MSFQRATRTQARARVAIDGPAKSGKSKTALRLAFSLGKKVAAIDTEFGSLSKYADDSDEGEGPYTFDVCNLRTFSPDSYTAEIQAAERTGFDVLIIDSLSHAWVGEGGALDIKDRQGGNSFVAWQKVTPIHRRMIDAILASRLHVIATMRSKTEYVLEEEINRNGKTVQVPKKIGMAPVQRDGTEYEFDMLLSMNQAHLCTVTGSRCPAMDGKSTVKPGAEFFRPYVEWLGLGRPESPRSTPEQINRYAAALNGAAAEPYRRRIQELYRVADFDQLTTTDAEDVLTKLEAAKVAADVP